MIVTKSFIFDIAWNLDPLLHQGHSKCLVPQQHKQHGLTETYDV